MFLHILSRISEDFDGQPIRLGGGIRIILHERASFPDDWCHEDIEVEGKNGLTIREVRENLVMSRKTLEQLGKSK